MIEATTVSANKGMQEQVCPYNPREYIMRVTEGRSGDKHNSQKNLPLGFKIWKAAPHGSGNCGWSSHLGEMSPYFCHQKWGFGGHSTWACVAKNEMASPLNRSELQLLLLHDAHSWIQSTGKGVRGTSLGTMPLGVTVTLLPSCDWQKTTS